MASYRLFIGKAPGIMENLKQDFGFNTIQAAAIVGNIGHECDGFLSMQEKQPIAGRGGYGWCQWTGPRRRDFESWCRERRLDINSDEANYGFLTLELSTTHRNARNALLRETDLVRSVRIFERTFLIAGVPHYPSRERFAQVALDAYNASRARPGARAFEIETVADDDYLDAGLEMLEGDATLAARPATAEYRSHGSDCGCSEGRQRLSRFWAEPDAVSRAPSGMQVESRVLTSIPTIHDTASWGARAPATAITLLNSKPKGIVIHHTASANVSNTSLAHARGLARSIQDFHMGPSRGWIDTGQHFTVSRGGHILEGRHRSLEAAQAGRKHVLGAHAGSACNNDYVGIENEGTYMTTLPPAAQWQALVSLCAWLCEQYGMSPDEIIGHRECRSTDCPGDRFFAQLGSLRQDVADAL